jgi:type I restriction enzyme M protein
MMDAPRSVTPMIRILRDMGQYKYDPADVFRDWVDFGVACLLVYGDKELAERLKRKYGKEYPKMNEMMLAWMQIMDHEVTDNPHSWFDALGTLYEYLASQSKRSWLGQFFTPPDLCDLMTHLGSDPAQRPVGKRINDPSSGSGRTLLSFNAYNPGNYLYGEDLDPICAKMTALNMAIHGCQGQVCCQNSLSLDDWRFGYQVNFFHSQGFPPVPHLQPITKEESYTWQSWQRRVEEMKAAKLPEPIVPKPRPVVQEPVALPAQLSLF